MELLEGESLREVILRRTPTTRQVLSWALQAAQGLAAAHAKGIVHRDVKPENLFLTSDGRIKILDFGLAKLTARTPVDRDAATESGLSVPGVIVGTVAYMSPEQVEAEGLDPRSDVFSLGVVLYELLAREHPFRRPTVPATLTAIVNETPPDRIAAPAADPARHRPDRPPVPREAAGRPLPVRAGTRGRARGASGGRQLGGGAAGRRGEEPVSGPLVLHRGGRGAILRPRGRGHGAVAEAPRSAASRRDRPFRCGQDVSRSRGRRRGPAGRMGGDRGDAGPCAAAGPRAGARAPARERPRGAPQARGIRGRRDGLRAPVALAAAHARTLFSSSTSSRSSSR